MTIKEFLDLLASDEGLLRQYLANPQGVALSHELTQKQIHVLASHDVVRIRHAIELESGDVTGIMIHIVM